MKPRRAAEATRTLAWMAMRMPSWPTRRENDAPMTKAIVRPMAMMIWAFLAPNSATASRLAGTM